MVTPQKTKQTKKTNQNARFWFLSPIHIRIWWILLFYDFFFALVIVFCISSRGRCTFHSDVCRCSCFLPGAADMIEWVFPWLDGWMKAEQWKEWCLRTIATLRDAPSQTGETWTLRNYRETAENYRGTAEKCWWTVEELQRNCEELLKYHEGTAEELLRSCEELLKYHKLNAKELTNRTNIVNHQNISINQ